MDTSGLIDEYLGESGGTGRRRVSVTSRISTVPTPAAPAILMNSGPMRSTSCKPSARGRCSTASVKGGKTLPGSLPDLWRGFSFSEEHLFQKNIRSPDRQLSQRWFRMMPSQHGGVSQ